MKKGISVVLAIMMILTTTLGSLTAFADTEIDETAPVIHSIEILNGNDYDAINDSLNVKINITEEGTGLCELRLDFDGADFRWETFYEDEEACAEDPILFSGEHTVNLNRDASKPVGEYELTYLFAKDINGNVFSLQGEEIKDYFGTVPKINITKSPYKDTWLKLESFNFSETEGIDASKSIDAEFTFQSNFEVYTISLDFYDQDTGKEEQQQLYVDLGEDGALKSGTHKVNFEIDNLFTKGKKVLYGVTFNYEHWCDIEAGAEGYEDTILHITKGKDPVINPEIIDFTFRNQEITAPDVVKIDLEIEDNGNDLNLVTLQYETENGKEFRLEGDLKKKKNGKYYVEVPIGPFLTEGKVNLNYISVQYAYNDGYDGYSSYFDSIWQHENPELLAKGNLNIDSGYNITYFGSLGNSNVPSVLKKMKAGETAVLDCRNYKKASKAIFTAIAGRDITVAFIDENVQWVFNGKDIKKSKCKQINLKSTIKVVSGSDAGFPDDTKVAKLIFQNNGELPGEVEMRINYDYLAAKYKFAKKNMKLTYLDSNQNAKVEDNDVDVAEDEYYEYEVDHNSTFVISKHKAKIGKTTVSAVPNGLKSTKIKWKKKSGNGYYVYRSTKKTSGFVRIATIKSNKTVTYVDKNVKKGKTYYYRVKPYSKYSSFNKTAKMSDACKAYTRLKNPTISSCKKVKKKTQVRLEWYGVKDAKYYEVYRSTTKNGTYKKVFTEKRDDTNYYVDKKVKKGKTYYYKVKAVYKKNSKYNSKLSTYKSVTVK